MLMVKPAKVYRGMASSAKLFMPSNIRWAMVTVLPPPKNRMPPMADRPRLMAMGTPRNNSTKKEISSQAIIPCRLLPVFQ